MVEYLGGLSLSVEKWKSFVAERRFSRCIVRKGKVLVFASNGFPLRLISLGGPPAPFPGSDGRLPGDEKQTFSHLLVCLCDAG
jgi:hypothetical protein